MDITEKFRAAAQGADVELGRSSHCPICDCPQVLLLSPSWKKYYNEKEFFFAEREWFASCDSCGTIFRYPLLSYDDYRKYGEDYYNQTNPGETVEEHAIWHYESFQKPNYDSLRSYLNQYVPPTVAKRWLDVGSIGYATSFDEYEFTTIEPDERIVLLGRKMFSKGILNRLHISAPRIQCHTIENFDADKKFDGIVFNNSFYCLPFPIEGLRKAASLLTADGHLIITISTFFSGAVPVRTDGVVSRMEDVLQGETLWVFHNPKSLEYLCQKAGFELIESREIPAYGKKTMQTFHFRKASSVSPNPILLEESKLLMEAKTKELFSGFLNQSSTALEVHNTSNTYFVGTLSILNDLVKLEFLDKIAGYVVFDSQIGSCIVNGTRCISWDMFCQSIEEKPGTFSVVIASYKYQDEIYAQIAGLGSCVANVFRPNRKSGMESLFFQFAGEQQPCKGFTLERVT